MQRLRQSVTDSVSLSTLVHYSAACEIHISFKGLTTLVTFDKNLPTHKELVGIGLMWTQIYWNAPRSTHTDEL